MARNLKKKLISIPALKKKVQSHFNKFIRERDSHNGFFICIACGKKLPIEKMHAGHFYGTRNFNWLRFNEDNCHGECSQCNTFNHESLIGYTLNLPKRIGQARFESLIEKSKERLPEFTRLELESLLLKYKKPRI